MLLCTAPSTPPTHTLRKKSRHDSDEYFTPSKGTSFLSSEVEELAGVVYRPRTKETKASYEILLSFIQQCIGDQVSVSLCICKE